MLNELDRICGKIVKSYEELVRTADLAPFEDYGTHESCLLCRYFGLRAYPFGTDAKCFRCPLGGKENGLGCATERGGGVGTYSNMNDILDQPDPEPEQIRRVAAARLGWLKSKFSEAGIDCTG